MAANKFVIELDLGNESMKLPQHIVDALTAIAKQVPNVVIMKGISTKVKDVNGNTIGTWSYK